MWKRENGRTIGALDLLRRLVLSPILLLLVWLCMALSATDIQKRDELPLNTKRLGGRVLIAWVGNHMQTIDVVALSTARGIVVIETSLVRSADARIRRTIEKELGRKDFKYLINTHYHHDHTCGNQVYADATIVGHRSVPAGMRAELTGEGLAKLIERSEALATQWADALSKASPDSREYHYFREAVALATAAIRELQEGFTPTYPTVLFEDSLVLDMGDMTLELYSVGGLHTPSDIFIFVPEEGLVAVGDVTPDRMLPYLRKESDWDLDLILENWGRIVESGREIKYVNMAHSDMDLSVETFKEQFRYFKTMWNGLRELHRQGATLEDAKKKYSIENDFPHFKNRTLVIRGTNIHEYNAEAIWERLGRK